LAPIEIFHTFPQNGDSFLAIKQWHTLSGKFKAVISAHQPDSQILFNFSEAQDRLSMALDIQTVKLIFCKMHLRKSKEVDRLQFASPAL